MINGQEQVVGDGIAHRNDLSAFLDVAPLAHALWRSVEAADFGRIAFKHPVLDLGCGYGEFAEQIFSKIDVGIDINTDDLAIAAKVGCYEKVQEADARKLPFEDGSFVTVFSVSVIEHIDSLPQVVGEVHRILKQRGTFVFSTPTTLMHDNLLLVKIFRFLRLPFLARMYIALHNRVFQHKSIKSPEWWKSELERSGFVIREFKGTISPQILHMHELLLPLAIPSQICRILFGKRMIAFKGLRQKLLLPLFSKWIKPDELNYINIFVVAEKK